MKKFLSWTGIVLGLVVLLAVLVPLGIRYWQWGFNQNRVDTVTCPECPVCVSDAKSDDANLQQEYAICKAELESRGAPANMVSAFCVPNGKGSVSNRLTTGTKVRLGTVTFDAQSHVWVLKDFVVPEFANYSFEYQGAESRLILAPFWTGSELGWQGNERVPFVVCWNFEGACELPQGITEKDLFPTP